VSRSVLQAKGRIGPWLYLSGETKRETVLYSGATMAIAKWNGEIVAESEKVEVVEGNIYFPPESIRSEFFEKSQTETICAWKGTAHYYHLKVHGQVNVDAAWYYPEAKDAAKNIEGYVAFWRGVEVSS